MIFNKILMQVPVMAPDTAAANKIQQATNAVTAQVDSLATKLSPDSIAAMTPEKLVNKFKYLDLGSLVTSLQPDYLAGLAHPGGHRAVLSGQIYHQQDL
jgi:hypothetical protein